MSFKKFFLKKKAWRNKDNFDNKQLVEPHLLQL